MTRKEQIIEKASKDSEIYYKVNDNYGDCFHGGFIDGAKWSDEHPKQGLISIEKACEWLENELFEDVAEPNPYYYSDVKSKSYDFLENFIEGFRKAMEE